MSELLPCLEIDSPQNKQSDHSVIWLHGLGADGHDFEPIVGELNLNMPVRFIFPHAPEMPVTINNGMRMPAWYDIKATQINQQQDETGIEKSQLSILALLQREIDRGVKSNNIILAGFSQGGAVALHTALRFEQPLAGIMGLSTYLPLADKVEKDIQPANKNTPIFLAHGNYDQVIPVQLAEQTQQTLNSFGYQTEFNKYNMEHSVCAEEINDISDWINRCFK
ncbi:MAG TPA: carboxylesterase [Gammaproteobacteria bacterium]|nr:carboxylesterase [Gammaproteobacteria bacterium]